VAARYRQITVGRSHDDAHPDSSKLQAGKVYSFPLHISRVVLLLLRQNGLGTSIDNLRLTTSGAAGIGLGTRIKSPRRTTGAAAGNGLGTALNYLRGAAGNGRAQRSGTRTTSAAAGNGLVTTIKYL